MKFELVVSSDGVKFFIDAYSLEKTAVFGGAFEKRWPFTSLNNLKIGRENVINEIKAAVAAFNSVPLDLNKREIIDL